MAFKGPAYVKTAWNFEERPVASAKLNTWDDRIEAALELVCLLLNLAWGGGSRGASGIGAPRVPETPISRSVAMVHRIS